MILCALVDALTWSILFIACTEKVSLEAKSFTEVNSEQADLEFMQKDWFGWITKWKENALYSEEGTKWQI